VLTAAQALARTEKLYRRLQSRRSEICTAREYYEGEQPLRFASDKWREYHASRYEKFSDNWCAPVANSPAERLRIDGFRLSRDPGQDQAEKDLWNYWLINDMEAQASQGLLESIITSRSCTLVWGDREGSPVVTWERPDQALVDYDPELPSVRVAGLKSWHDEDTEYATLYTPDWVWKWQRPYLHVESTASSDVPRADAFFRTTAGLIVPTTGTRNWVPRELPGEPWPLPNPLGEVPLVEWPNRPLLGGDPMSDISGTMAMQDAINLLWAYLFTAADFASMPARVVMGQEPPKIPILDNAGNKVGERAVDLKKLAEDRILWLTGQNTSIGQWDPAKLDVFTAVVETGVAHLAAQTRTPPHYLILGKGMVNINADGMRAAEAGLVNKVHEQQTFFGTPARETFRLMALVRDQAAVAKRARLGTVVWKDAENRSEAQLVDALQKLGALGFPFQWLAERYGLSDTEVERLLEMRAVQAATDPVGVMTRQLAQLPPAPPAG
jgi:hypothetical protein